MISSTHGIYIEILVIAHFASLLPPPLSPPKFQRNSSHCLLLFSSAVEEIDNTNISCSIIQVYHIMYRMEDLKLPLIRYGRLDINR